MCNRVFNILKKNFFVNDLCEYLDKYCKKMRKNFNFIEY